MDFLAVLAADFLDPGFAAPGFLTIGFLPPIFLVPDCFFAVDDAACCGSIEPAGFTGFGAGLAAGLATVAVVGLDTSLGIAIGSVFACKTGKT